MLDGKESAKLPQYVHDLLYALIYSLIFLLADKLLSFNGKC